MLRSERQVVAGRLERSLRAALHHTESLILDHAVNARNLEQQVRILLSAAQTLLQHVAEFEVRLHG